MTKAAPCAAILLAAGLSSRYRAELQAQSQTEAPSKLLAEMNGRPLVRHVAEAALASQASPLIVVTGYEQDLITASLAGLPAQFIHNADYATGMASSLRIGIAAVPPDCSAAVILLGDMPQIKADLINQLIDSFLASGTDGGLAFAEQLSNHLGKIVGISDRFSHAWLLS